MIIELYGDGVCFTYPTNKRISQMVFSTKSNPASFLESARVSPVQRVASSLEQELKAYKFGLDKSFCAPKDLQLSLTALHENPLAKWEEFLLQLFKGKKISNIVKYVVFQILHYAMSGGKELTLSMSWLLRQSTFSPDRRNSSLPLIITVYARATTLSEGLTWI